MKYPNTFHGFAEDKLKFMQQKEGGNVVIVADNTYVYIV